MAEAMPFLFTPIAQDSLAKEVLLSDAEFWEDGVENVIRGNVTCDLAEVMDDAAKILGYQIRR